MNYTLNHKFALFYSANNVQTAHILDNSLSIQEYFDLSQTQDYQDFSDKQFKLFCDGWEGALLHRLHKLTIELQNMSPSDKNYPALNREYVNVLKTTSPVLEKLARISKETQTFDGLEIRIMGVDNGGEKE